MALMETTRTLAAGESLDFSGPWDWVYFKALATADVISLQFNRGESDVSGEALARTNYRYAYPKAKNFTLQNKSAGSVLLTVQAGTGDFLAPSQDISVTASIAAGQQVQAIGPAAHDAAVSGNPIQI